MSDEQKTAAAMTPPKEYDAVIDRLAEILEAKIGATDYLAITPKRCLELAQNHVRDWMLMRQLSGKETSPEDLAEEIERSGAADVVFAVQVGAGLPDSAVVEYLQHQEAWDKVRNDIAEEIGALIQDEGTDALLFTMFGLLGSEPKAIAANIWASWARWKEQEGKPITVRQFQKDYARYKGNRYRLVLFYAECTGLQIEGNEPLAALKRQGETVLPGVKIPPLVATNKIIHLKSKVAQATQHLTARGVSGMRGAVKVFGDKDPNALTEIMITTPQPLKDMLAPQLDDETWLIHDALLSLKEYGGNDGVTFNEFWKFLTKNEARPSKEAEEYLEDHLTRLIQTVVDIKANSEIDPGKPRKDGVVRIMGPLFPLYIVTAIVRGKPVRYISFSKGTSILWQYTNSMKEPQKQLIPAGYWALYDLDQDGRRLKTKVQSTKRRRIIVTYLLYEIFDRRADLKSGTRRHDLNNCIILTTHTNSRGRTIEGLYDKLGLKPEDRKGKLRINADIETVLRNWMPAALEGLPDTPPLIYGYSFGKSAHDEPALFLDWSSPERKKALEEAAKKPQRRPRKKKDAQQ